MNRHAPWIVGALAAAVLWPGVAHSQPTPDKTVSAHIRELQNQDPNIRAYAAQNLGSLGEQAAPAVSALIEALSDKDSRVRQSAAAALGRVGQHAASAVPALTELAGNDNEFLRRAGLEALAQIVPAVVTDVPNLIAGLKSSDVRRRRWAAEALVRLKGKAKPALNELIPALKDESADVRAAAALALRNIREDARPAVPALISALQDENPKVREHAAQALGWIGPGAEDAVPQLIKAIGDPDAHVRRNAARAFTTDWPGAERAIPALITALSDSDRMYGAATSAGYALNDLARHGHSQVVVPALLELLKRAGKDAPRSAINALGLIGPDARPAIPALKELLTAGDATVRRAAGEALGKIEGSAGEGIRALIADLHQDDYSVRAAAASSLGKIGPAASAAVPELISILEDRNQQAFAAFRQAAEQGVAEAQFALAIQYRDGLGTPPDIAAAVAWFQKAANQGHAEAQRNLGILYRQGRGVPQNDRLAEQWYRAAVDAHGALARLRNQPVNLGAYESALVPHQTGESSDFRPKEDQKKLLLAITRFNEDARQAVHQQVRSDGALMGFLDIYDWSRRSGTPYPLTLSRPELDRLNSLLRALPEGVEFAPVQQKLIVSCRVGDRWTTRLYDSEALPRVVRNLLDLVEAPASTMPFPPQERMTLATHCRHPDGLIYEPDGTLLSWGHELKIERWKNGRLANADDRRALQGHPIAVSSDGARVVTSSRQQLSLWNSKTGERVADVGESSYWNDNPGEAVFSADGQTLVIQEYKHHQVHVWAAAAGRHRGTIQVGQFFDRSIGVSADGKQLALSCQDKTTRVWDLTTLRLKHEIAGFPTISLAFSPNGQALAGISQQDLIVWDLEGNTKRFQVRAGYWAGLLCFSQDGTFVLAKQRQRMIKLWDASDGRALGIAEGHTRNITALALSPDGKEIASASEDGTIKVWNIEQLRRAD